MPSRKKQAAEVGERLNLSLPKKLNKDLTDYCIRWAGANGKMPVAMKAAVVREALQAWLEKNREDYSFDF